MMSALPPKADMCDALAHVCFGPEADITPFRRCRVIRYDGLSLASGAAMRRRNKTGGKEGKIQRTKTLKRHNALKTARHRNFSAAEQIGALTRELKEAREQQTATAEVLRVISGSPGELEPVFQTMLENARRICEAEFGVLYRCEGEALRAVAMHGAPQAFVEERRRNALIRPPPQTALGRAMATKQSVQIADIENEPHYFDAPPGYSAVVLAKLSGARTVLAVPM